MALALRQSQDSDLTEIADINVTPFIDVILVLLIIFMVAAPLSTVDVAVDLPVSSAQPQPRPDKPIFLTVKADLTLAIGDDEVARDELQAALDRLTTVDRQQRVFLRADKTVAYGELMKVMNLMRDAGYLKVALVGLEEFSYGADGRAAVAFASRPLRTMTLALQGGWRRPWRTPANAIRWIAAAAIVVAAHFAVVWLAVDWRSADPIPGEPPAAVMVELSPIVAAPISPIKEVAPGPQSAEAAPPPADLSTSDSKRDAAEPTPSEHKDPAAPPAKPEAATAPEEPQPDLPPAAEAPPAPQVASPDATIVPPPGEAKFDSPPAAHIAATIPAATPQSRTVRSEPLQKTEPVSKLIAHEESRPRRNDRKKPPAPDDAAARRASAPPTANARQSETASAPSASASINPAAALATWKGSLLALLNRNKRYPANASADGTANIAFTIDRTGAVTSARLVGSSGDRWLDEEAIALPRRSSPVPPPPPELGRGPITLTVPIRFNR